MDGSLVMSINGQGIAITLGLAGIAFTLSIIYNQLKRIADYHQIMLELAKRQAGLDPSNEGD